MTSSVLNRRAFLRAAGVTVALPMLESLAPFAGAAAAAKPQRMVAINASLGLIPDYFFPQKAGREYELTPYLEVLKNLRESFTVFSGLSHPEVDGGHYADVCFLTGAPHPQLPSFRNRISLDQYALARLKPDTRIPCLVLGTEAESGSISIDTNGVRLPAYIKPTVLFKKLFTASTAKERQQQMNRLKEGHSILDVVLAQAKQMQGKVNGADRDRLDQYFTAVRDVEKDLARAEGWVKQPKPKVSEPPPKEDYHGYGIDKFYARIETMLKITALALQTDLTRFVTLGIGYFNSYHHASHHGRDPKELAKVREIEIKKLQIIRDFLIKLQKTPEGGGTLLDRTMMLFGSNLGDANGHKNVNLPILAGGGFKHGQHLAFDRQHNTPLCNLYVSMLQRLGIETDRFASSTGRLSRLVMA